MQTLQHGAEAPVENAITDVAGHQLTNRLITTFSAPALLYCQLNVSLELGPFHPVVVPCGDLSHCSCCSCCSSASLDSAHIIGRPIIDKALFLSLQIVLSKL